MADMFSNYVTGVTDPSGTLSGVHNVFGGGGTGADYGKAAGAAIGTLFAPGIGTVLGASLAKPVMNAFGYKSSSAKKKEKSANAYNNALNNSADVLNKRYDLGSDNSDLLAGYQQALSDAYNKNSKYFYKQNTDDILNGYLDDLTNKYKAGYQQSFDNLFTGFGTTNDYLDNIWTRQSDDQFVNDYLQKYYDDAMNRLDTAKSRGLLNESGYNTALNELNTRNSAAKGQVNELTDAVVNDYRDQWGTLGSNIQAGIDNFNLSQRNSNLGENWTNQYNNLLGEQQQNFDANLNNAVAGYTPYDVSDLLATARSSQGVINPGENNSELLQSLKDRENKNQNKIGLGNQGIF